MKLRKAIIEYLARNYDTDESLHAELNVNQLSCLTNKMFVGDTEGNITSYEVICPKKLFHFSVDIGIYFSSKQFL